MITILGAGSMGSALSITANDKVRFWTIESDVNKQINELNENKKYLPGIKLKGYSTMSIKEALIGSDIIVISVPSRFVRDVVRKASNYISSEAIIINVAKGLEQGTNKTMSEVINEEINNPIISVGGPSIAVELARKNPTFVVYASRNKEALIKAKEAFKSDFYNITISDDPLGVELCSSLKNVIAIMAGFSDGLGYGANTKAGIITKGLSEMRLIASTLGAKPETINGLAGLGDLIVTCNSKHSRNRSFGELIGKGFSVNDALRSVKQTVEGVVAVNVFNKIINDKGINCPIISSVNEVLNNKLSVKDSLLRVSGNY